MPAIEFEDKEIKFASGSGFILQDGKRFEFEIILDEPGRLIVRSGNLLSEINYGVAGVETELVSPRGGLRFKVLTDRDILVRGIGGNGSGEHTHAEVRAPMPGLVVKVLIGKGDAVRKGETIVVLEAMKMENDIRVAHDSEIAEVHVKEGDTVEKDQVIATLK